MILIFLESMRCLVFDGTEFVGIGVWIDKLNGGTRSDFLNDEPLSSQNSVKTGDAPDESRQPSRRRTCLVHEGVAFWITLERIGKIMQAKIPPKWVLF